MNEIDFDFLPENIRTKKFRNQRLVDRYEKFEFLAEGGQSYVFSAYDKKRETDCAVKIFKMPEGLSPIELDFLNSSVKKDIAALNRLKEKPYIVQMYDSHFSNVKGEESYLSMEYVRFGTLGSLINRGFELDIGIKIDMMNKIAQSLRLVHDAGIIHRDIKPGNIFVDYESTIFQPKISDFGFAKLEKIDQGYGVLEESMLTFYSGYTIGTWHYLPPEGFNGKDNLTRKSDIYSLGVSFYQLLTNTFPHTATTREELIEKKKTKEPIIPSFASSSIPIELDNVILKMIDRDPEKRYSSMQEVIVDLLEVWKKMHATTTRIKAATIPTRYINLLEEKDGKFPAGVIAKNAQVAIASGNKISILRNKQNYLTVKDFKMIKCLHSDKRTYDLSQMNNEKAIVKFSRLDILSLHNYSPENQCLAYTLRTFPSSFYTPFVSAAGYYHFGSQDVDKVAQQKSTEVVCSYEQKAYSGILSSLSVNGSCYAYLGSDHIGIYTLKKEKKELRSTLYKKLDPELRSSIVMLHDDKYCLEYNNADVVLHELGSISLPRKMHISELFYDKFPSEDTYHINIERVLPGSTRDELLYYLVRDTKKGRKHTLIQGSLSQLNNIVHDSSSPFIDITYSPDRSHLSFITADEQIYVWDMTTNFYTADFQEYLKRSLRRDVTGKISMAKKKPTGSLYLPRYNTLLITYVNIG